MIHNWMGLSFVQHYQITDHNYYGLKRLIDNCDLERKLHLKEQIREGVDPRSLDLCYGHDDSSIHPWCKVLSLKLVHNQLVLVDYSLLHCVHDVLSREVRSGPKVHDWILTEVVDPHFVSTVWHDDDCSLVVVVDRYLILHSYNGALVIQVEVVLVPVVQWMVLVVKEKVEEVDEQVIVNGHNN